MPLPIALRTYLQTQFKPCLLMLLMQGLSTCSVAGFACCILDRLRSIIAVTKGLFQASYRAFSNADNGRSVNLMCSDTARGLSELRCVRSDLIRKATAVSESTIEITGVMINPVTGETIDQKELTERLLAQAKE